MRYLNFILTLMTVLMIIMIVQNCKNPVTPVKANEDIQKVQIQKIGQYNVSDGFLLVKIKK